MQLKGGHRCNPRIHSVHQCRPVERSLFAQSPEAAGKARGTFVDAALTLNKRGQGFGGRLVLSRVPQRARPFGSHPLVCPNHALSPSPLESFGILLSSRLLVHCPVNHSW